MLALLHFHDDMIHFDPANCADDHNEKERAKALGQIQILSCMGK